MKTRAALLLMALVIGCLVAVVNAAPASAYCRTKTSLVDVVEVCEREPSMPSSGARDTARRTLKKAAGTRRAICVVKIGNVCEEALGCVTQAGDQGTYYALFDAGVKRPGRACVPTPRRPGEPVAPAPPAVSDTLVARVMRTLDWQVPGLAVQPPGGATLVNLATNVFARGDRVQTLTTQLLTRRVTIEARAVRYEWSFGDGARLSTAQPGRPYPALDVTHRYPAPGRFRLTLATSFTGRFRVDDGPWRPVPGVLRLVAPAQPLRVVEARPQLRGE